MPASRSREGQGEGIVGGGPEPASRQATVQPGAETPVYNDFFFFFLTSPDALQAHSTSPQSTKSQSKAQPRGLGKTADPLSSPHPSNPHHPPLHLTSLEKGSEGAGHLLVSENLETALS